MSSEIQPGIMPGFGGDRVAWPCKVEQEHVQKNDLGKDSLLYQELPDDKHNLWRLILEFMAWCQFYVADILDFIGQAPSSGYFYYHFLFCLTQSLML